MAGPNLEIPIQICNVGLYSKSSGDVIKDICRIYLDDSWWAGDTVNFYLEVVAINNDSAAREVRLLDDTNTSVGAVDIPASTTAETRVRGSAFASGLDTGGQWYSIEMEQSTSDNQVEASVIRLIVVITGCTKCAVAMPQGTVRNQFNDDQAFYMNGGGAWGEDVGAHNWRYTAAWFAGDGGVTWDFQARIHNNSGTTTTSEIRLYNKTDASALSGTGIVTHSGGAGYYNIRCQPSFAAGEDGDTIVAETKRTGTGTTEVYCLNLFAIITTPTAVPCIYSLARLETGSFFDTEIIVHKRCQINKSSYSGASVEGYVESCVWDRAAGQSQEFALHDHLSSDSDTAHDKEMANVRLNPTSETAKHAVYRSADIYSELTDGNRYVCGGYSGSDDIRFTDFWLIVKVTYAAASTISRTVGENIPPFRDTAGRGVHVGDSTGHVAPPFQDAVQVGVTQFIGVSTGSRIPVPVDAAAKGATVGESVGDNIPPFSDNVVTQAGVFLGTHFLVLIDIYFDGGLYRTSPFPVSALGSTNAYWDGKVIGMGDVDRSIEVPAGLSRVGDGSVTIADTDQSMRTRLATDPARGKTIDIRLVPVGGSTLTAQRVYRGEISSVTLSEGAVTFNYTDKTQRWFNEPIPNLIHSDNFADLPSGDYVAFAPIVVGDASSLLAGDQGAVQCPQLDSGNSEFCVSRHICDDVPRVYRKLADEEEYSIVSTYQYSIETETVTEGGITYTITKIVFTSDQGEGTLVRADVQGLTMLDDSAYSDNLSENVLRYLDLFIKEALEIDLVSFGETQTVFDTRGWKMAGAIQDQITHREALSQMVASFNADLFQDRNGKIALTLTPEDTASSVEFTDNFHLLKDSVQVHMPEPVCTTLHYKFAKQPSGVYYFEDSYENTNLLDDIGVEIERIQEMPFIWDITTADLVAAFIMGYLSEYAYRIDFALDAPRNLNELELAKIVGVSHYGGVADGGWSDEPFKISAIRYNNANLAYDVSAVKAVELPPNGMGAELDVRFESILFSGPYLFGSRTLGGIFKHPTNDDEVRAVYSRNWGETWTYVDITLTNDVDALNSFQDPDNPKWLHVAHQEATTGRVGYSRFNLSTKLWDIENEEIQATCTIDHADEHKYAENKGAAVYVTTDSDGTPVVAFADEVGYADPADGTYPLEADSPGTYYFTHIYFSHRTGLASWSSPVRGCTNATTRCIATSNNIGCLWRGTSNRVHLFYTYFPGDFVAGTADIESSTYNASSGSASDNGRMVRTSLVFYEAPFTFGVPATDSNGDGRMMHKGYGGDSYSWVIEESELVAGAYDVGGAANTFLMDSTDNNDGAIYEGSGATTRAQCHTLEVDGDIEEIVSSNAASPDIPTWNGVQCGYEKGYQDFHALVMKFGSTKYIAAFGTYSATKVRFQLYHEDYLPTAGYDEAAWEADYI